MKEKNHSCVYCHNHGFHGDELTGGESYCTCPVGKWLKEYELLYGLLQDQNDIRREYELFNIVNNK